jgi:transposase-like protein
MVRIAELIDDPKCYEVVRKLRWPEGVRCPHCESENIKKRGHHDRYSYRQRYICNKCQKQFDDLSETVFEGHHRPLREWVLCLYFMGLNLSNKQIAEELELPENEVQMMTTQLREGVQVKKSLLP